MRTISVCFSFNFQWWINKNKNKVENSRRIFPIWMSCLKPSWSEGQTFSFDLIFTFDCIQIMKHFDQQNSATNWLNRFVSLSFCCCCYCFPLYLFRFFYYTSGPFMNDCLTHYAMHHYMCKNVRFFVMVALISQEFIWFWSLSRVFKSVICLWFLSFVWNNSFRFCFIVCWQFFMIVFTLFCFSFVY